MRMREPLQAAAQRPINHPHLHDLSPPLPLNVVQLNLLPDVLHMAIVHLDVLLHGALAVTSGLDLSAVALKCVLARSARLVRFLLLRRRGGFGGLVFGILLLHDQREHVLLLHSRHGGYADSIGLAGLPAQARSFAADVKAVFPRTGGFFVLVGARHEFRRRVVAHVFRISKQTYMHCVGERCFPRAWLAGFVLGLTRVQG